MYQPHKRRPFNASGLDEMSGNPRMRELDLDYAQRDSMRSTVSYPVQEYHGGFEPEGVRMPLDSGFGTMDGLPSWDFELQYPKRGSRINTDLCNGSRIRLRRGVCV